MWEKCWAQNFNQNLLHHNIIFTYISENIRIMMKHFFPLLILLVVSGACKNQQKELNNDLLSQLRNSVLYNHLDEADSLLSSIDTLVLDERQLNHYKLSKAYYLFSTGENEQSHRLLEHATTYYRRHGSAAETAELALFWAFMLEVQYMKAEAYEEYINAYHYFSQQRNSRLYFLNLLGLARTGVNQMEYLALAEQYLQKNYHVRDQYLYFYTIASQNSDHAKTLSNLKNCLHLLDNPSFTRDDRYSIYSALSYIYIKNDQLDSGQYFDNKIFIDSLELNMQTKNFYLIKAYAANKNKRLNESKYIIDKLKHYKEFPPSFKSEVYLQEYGFYLEQDNQKAARNAIYNYAQEVRKSHDEEVSNKMALITIWSQLKQKDLQIKNHRLTNYIILLLSIILVMILVFFFIRHRKFLVNTISAYKQKILDHDRQHEVKDRQLSELIQRQFDKVNGKERSQELDEFTGSDWHQFKTIFEAVHPYFTQKLRQRHPSLSTVDIRYCMCIYGDKDNTQAAEILSVSKDAVKKARAKLKKTFGLQSIHELGEYLQGIEKELSNGNGKFSAGEVN